MNRFKIKDENSRKPKSIPQNAAEELLAVCVCVYSVATNHTNSVSRFFLLFLTLFTFFTLLPISPTPIDFGKKERASERARNECFALRNTNKTKKLCTRFYSSVHSVKENCDKRSMECHCKIGETKSDRLAS